MYKSEYIINNKKNRMKFAVLSLLGLVAVQAIQMEESFYDDDFLVEDDEELLQKSVGQI